MAILLLLLPLSILLVGTAIYWFLWAVDNAQFENVDKEGVRALQDDVLDPKPHARGDSTQ